MLGTGSDSLYPMNEAMPFPQPTKTCSLGKRLEMLLGGRGVGMKMSTTQVSTSSLGRGQWGSRRSSAGSPI